MSLPEKKIKKVQLPDSNTYEIIPEKLQKNSYEAALPSLTQDSVLALSSDIKYIPHFPSAMSGTEAVSTSPRTSALWNATCDEITNLYDGMVMIIRVPVKGSDSYGVALKVNNGAYHPVVYDKDITVGARYSVGSTIVAVYNATQTAPMFYNSTSIVTVTGVWQVYDYNTDTDTQYRLRTNDAIYINKSGQSTNRRTLLFEVEGGLSATNTTIDTGTSKTPINFKYIPGGQIRYYSVDGTISANGQFNKTGLWEQYAFDLRYAFNTGTTLTEGKPVYIRMVVNSDGTLSQDASSAGDNPIVQELPNTEDNKVYVYLGRTVSFLAIELEPVHPIYEYKNGAIRLRTNSVSSGGGATSVEVTGSGNAVTDASYNASTGKITLSKGTTFATSASLNNYLPLSGGSSHALTAPVYIGHSDLSFIGTKGAFGFRATDTNVTSKHLGQINLSKNFGGDGQQYGIQMSALDVTNNKYNQFRVYQNGIAYQQYDNATNTTANLFTVGTNGDATIFGNLEIKPNVVGSTPAVTINSEAELSTAVTLLKWENTFTSGGTDTVTTVTVGAPRSINGADVSLTIPTQSGTLALKSEISVTDVQVNGTSILSSGTANLVTNSAYNSSSNKIATMTDISNAIIPVFEDGYEYFSSDIRDYIVTNLSIRPSIIFMVRIRPYPGEFLVTCIPNENKFIITNDNERYVATVSSISGSDYVWASLMTSANKVDYATSTELATKQNTLTTSSVNDGTLNKAIGFDSNGNLVKGATGSDISIETTYSALKTLRDGGTLTPGTWYRITDYTTTTTQSNTSSAGHQFDVIVKADGTNKLNENAFAIQHSGDTYFANSNLSAWKLKYCLDNDTNRFAWADSTNGKGVIYRMIDEFNNDIPYDFKNILFTLSGKYTNAFTFSYTENNTIKDASLLGLSILCYNNVMKEFIESNKQQLNFNVFYSTHTYLGCYNNTFGEDCYNNTFGYGCYNNIFGNNCCDNIFWDDCSDNTFGNSCYNNTFAYESNDNIFGNGCSYNTSSGSFANNTFGSLCTHNTFGIYCSYNTFGNLCNYIKFGDASSTIESVKNIIIEDNCQYLYINSTDTSASSSNYLQNVHIHLGVTGTSSNRLTITIPDRNLSYETNVYMNANDNIEMVVNNGGGGGGTAEAISYTTTAPTAANTDGDLKFVVLSSEPSTRYAGYFYIVTSGTDIALSNSEIDTLWANN